mgnify:CR=1 FL=1
MENVLARLAKRGDFLAKLDDVVDREDFRPILGRICMFGVTEASVHDGQMTKRRGSVFLSSPRSSAPGPGSAHYSLLSTLLSGLKPPACSLHLAAGGLVL